MGRYVTVSTKVPEDLKREAEKLGIRISEVLRRALERGQEEEAGGGEEEGG